ncbi:MAG: RluA family pseudouridine synthase [Tissierellia bacterium]|nr:RluA family pseudouridine synthase [Tissierellia bacterium]
MKEVIIWKNESEQRLDRFLRKYLSEAPQSFIYKMIRKKNIKLNNKRAKPDTMIFEGDTIQLYLADETIEKFRGEIKIVKSTLSPEIIYEDNNIILINKPVGILSHSATKDNGNNIVDSMIYYLYKQGEYNPRDESTFVPSICNRLDRNTSGIIIGGKNYQSLKIINDAMKEGNIGRYYKTIVKGTIKKDKIIKGYLIKDEEVNKVEIIEEEIDNSKKIATRIKVLDTFHEYSLLEVELITGRTHQIRAHLASIGHPIIGDIKYGDKETNEYFKEKYDLDNQLLHGYRIVFSKLAKPLDYLNQKEFIGLTSQKFIKIQKDLFKL